MYRHEKWVKQRVINENSEWNKWHNCAPSETCWRLEAGFCGLFFWNILRWQLGLASVYIARQSEGPLREVVLHAGTYAWVTSIRALVHSCALPSAVIFADSALAFQKFQGDSWPLRFQLRALHWPLTCGIRNVTSMNKSVHSWWFRWREAIINTGLYTREMGLQTEPFGIRHSTSLFTALLGIDKILIIKAYHKRMWRCSDYGIGDVRCSPLVLSLFWVRVLFSAEQYAL